MFLSNCVVCGNKKSRSIKQRKTSQILRSLGLRTPLSNIPCSACKAFTKTKERIQTSKEIGDSNCML